MFMDQAVTAAAVVPLIQCMRLALRKCTEEACSAQLAGLAGGGVQRSDVILKLALKFIKVYSAVWAPRMPHGLISLCGLCKQYTPSFSAQAPEVPGEPAGAE